MGFLRGTLAVVVILVKGHAFPAIVNVLPVGCDPLALVDKFTPVEDNIGRDPLALVDKFTPIEDNIGLLETTFDEDAVLMFVFPEDEETATLREILEHERSLNLLNTFLDYA
nr:hypothetical protein [Tanacetum cinerariifolium]